MQDGEYECRTLRAVYAKHTLAAYRFDAQAAQHRTPVFEHAPACRKVGCRIVDALGIGACLRCAPLSGGMANDVAQIVLRVPDKR